MIIVPSQKVEFDDAATLAMGEAFDQACKSLRKFGSAPEIIANLIAAAAKNGERDPSRLHEQVLEAFGITDMSMASVSVGSARPDPTYAALSLFWCVFKLSTPRHLRMPDHPADEAGGFLF